MISTKHFVFIFLLFFHGSTLLWGAEILFITDLDSCSYGGATIADIDGDGDLEILFGTYFNDERVIALHHDGTFLLSIPSGGGPVDNSVTVADLNRDGIPEIMWGNSATTRFHVADAGGVDLWTYVTFEVLDAPEAVGDVNGDGRLDIVLASCGGDTRPGLRAFTGITGGLLWSADVGGCYQSAPLLFDQDGDGLLDVVVSTWFDNKVRGFSGLDGTMRWEAVIGDWTYHAGSFGDLNGDGIPDVAVGDYSATVWAIDGSDGRILWSRPLPGETYIFGPTAMGDLDGNGILDVVVAGAGISVFDAAGNPGLSFPLPGYCTRGPVLVDFDGDEHPDILTATDFPSINVYSGINGSELFSHAFEQTPETGIDFQPAVMDIDDDGQNDVFVVMGRGYYQTMDLNWGKAVALKLGGTGSPWPTFSHDHHHSGNFHYTPGAGVNSTPGDLNLDDLVNVIDLVTLRHYLEGNLPQGFPPFIAPRAAADVNRDQKMNTLDQKFLESILTENR